MDTSHQLRLKVDAHFAGNASLYVLALDTVSIVAVLFDLGRLLAVTLRESFMDEQEYAAEIVQALCPLASNARLLPPGIAWKAHATICLHTETRMLGDSETQNVVLIRFCVDDLECREQLRFLSLQGGAKIRAAYEEEAAIIRALDGFAGDAAQLLEKLQLHLDCGAVLARTQLLCLTAHRAQTGLRSIYTDHPGVLTRIEEFSTWLSRLQGNENHIIEESATSPILRVPSVGRMH